MPRLRWLVVRSDSYTSSSSPRSRPAKRESPSRMKGPLLGRVGAGHQARGGERAGVDERVRPPVDAELDGEDRVEGHAGVVAPQALGGGARADGLADEGDHERFGHALDGLPPV